MTAMKQTTLDGSDPKDHGNPGKRGASAKDEDASSASEPPPSKRARKNQGKHEVEEQSKEAPRLSEGVLERGTIHFVYKPKVEQDDPSSIDDISKLHLILSPANGSKVGYRLISVGKKQMPSPNTHVPLWATVAAVGNDKSELRESLGPSTYETKTRGTRHQPAARPVGVGAYVLHSKPSSGGTGGTTHLAYVLATPSTDTDGDEVGKVQKDLNIYQEASVTIQVKDPKADAPPQASLPADRRASYPASLQALFRTKFIQVNPPTLLDYIGSELLLIGGQKGDEGIRKEIGKEAEQKTGEEAEKMGDPSAEDILKDLRLDASKTDTAPIEGHWA